MVTESMQGQSLVGQKFCKLFVLADMRAQGKQRYLCQCDCGKTTEVLKYNLTSGQTRSCGCLHREKTIERNRTHKIIKHGKTESPIYHAWEAMRQRCTNSNHPQWKDYGGRGITVCTAWNNFVNFYRDMGDPPEGFTLDRIDVNGSYTAENCRWASWVTQARNKRHTLLLTCHGLARTMKEWSELTGLSYEMLRARHKRGWSDEAILHTAPGFRNAVLQGKWSRNHSACIVCGETRRRHQARGYCTRCYLALIESRREPAPYSESTPWQEGTS